MGVYNEYYKKYYSDVKDKNQTGDYRSARYRTSSNDSGKKISSFPIMINIFGRGYPIIFTIQSVIVLIMILAIIGAKMFNNPVSQDLYNKGMHYINEGIFEDDTAVKKKAEDVLDYIKSILQIDKKHESYIYSNFSLPIEKSRIKSIKEDGDGLVLCFSGIQDIKSSFSGSVKSIEGNDKKNIIIDHGGGIEIKYSGFDDVSVNEGDELTVDSVIGKIDGDSGNLSLEVYYMGSRLNASECFKIEGV